MNTVSVQSLPPSPISQKAASCWLSVGRARQTSCWCPLLTAVANPRTLRGPVPLVVGWHSRSSEIVERRYDLWYTCIQANLSIPINLTILHRLIICHRSRKCNYFMLIEKLIKTTNSGPVIKPDSQQCVTATHQVLITKSSKLLKLLWDEQLSAAYCTADRPQHYRRNEEDW